MHFKVTNTQKIRNCVGDKGHAVTAWRPMGVGGRLSDNKDAEKYIQVKFYQLLYVFLYFFVKFINSTNQKSCRKVFFGTCKTGRKINCKIF